MAITVEQVIAAAPHGPQPPAPALLVTVDRGALRLRLLSLGAAIASLETADADGRLGHVHLRLPAAADYAEVALNPHLGATVGRYANRIGEARFTLDGIEFRTDDNRPPNTLHGGTWGFDRLVWSLTEAVSQPGRADRVTFALRSPDGDMGFPGTMEATVTYVVADDSVAMHYGAATDAPTVVSFTSHGYWNLDDSGSIRDHTLAVAASRVLAVDADVVPTGALDPLDGSALDLRRPVRLGDVLDALPSGLDHCYVVDGADLDASHSDPELRPVAVLSDGVRWMRVSTDCPGLQVYTGNALHPPFAPHQSVSLETQRLPDAPNHAGFGPFALRPGESYASTTVLEFGAGLAPALP